MKHRQKETEKKRSVAVQAQPSVRAMAKDILLRIEHAGQYSTLALHAAIVRADLSPADRGLLTALCYGVTERRLTLDYYIDALSERKADEIDADTRTVLRMGLYQMTYMDKIPPHAAVNESVALAPRRAAGFVNAILRTYLRRNKQIPLPDPDKDPLFALSIRTSVPVPLCKKLADIFGMQQTEAILSASLLCDKSGADVRVNTLRTTPSALALRLGEQKIKVDPLPFLDNGLHLTPPAVTSAAFREGLYIVQDTASQYACAVLDPLPGQTLIDACACPGSKSFTAAMYMQNRGHIFSCDLHENKLSLVRDGANRLGIDIIQTVCADARIPRPEWQEIADRVLCDVPCSGYGVIAKKPEIRYKDPADAERLPEIQYAILENCAHYLKKGGRLVYSTCTVLPQENEAVIARFLESNPAFRRVPFSVGGISCPDGMLTLLPDGTHDGFFIACLTKEEPTA